MGLIEADAILASLRESRDRANVWLSDCLEYGSNMTERAKQTVMTFNECILKVKGAPTVDAVPVRHGQWIDIDSKMYTWKIRCSKCGHERSMMSTGQIYPMYCEDCGARMDGKDGEQP